MSKDNITSYNPGPNLEPTKAILNGWPTPLKLVLFFSINDFITGSSVSLDNEFIFSYSIINSLITFLDKSSISFLSSIPISILSLIMYWALFQISSNVFALFFKKPIDLTSMASLDWSILVLYLETYSLKKMNRFFHL